RPEVGAIFTRPQAGAVGQGIVPGTLSLDVARGNHPRAGEILVSANWTAKTNAAGYAGTTTDNGVAGPGSSSMYRPPAGLIAPGPASREHAVSAVPTATVDVAPTVLHLLGLPIPKSMTGRVIAEALRSGPTPESVRVTETAERARTADRSYAVTAHISVADGHRYLDFTEVERH